MHIFKDMPSLEQMKELARGAINQTVEDTH
jgi:hypothetical protein